MHIYVRFNKEGTCIFLYDLIRGVRAYSCDDLIRRVRAYSCDDLIRRVRAYLCVI